MGAERLSMDYNDMQAELTTLTQCVSDFRDATSRMNTSVGTLCDGWVAAASDTYRDDYARVADSFTQAAEIVEQLIESVQKYIQDMESVDQAYSRSKVR